MYRYRPTGWRHESYRHYLAAKGIKTKKIVRYPVFKEGAGLFDTTEVHEVDKELRQRVVEEAKEMAIDRLHKEEDENKMQSEWTERFMRDEFPALANKYLSDQLYTRKQFLDEVKRKVDDYAHVHSGTLKVFDW